MSGESHGCGLTVLRPERVSDGRSRDVLLAVRAAAVIVAVVRLLGVAGSDVLTQ
jgi:hypothetical protein